MTRPLLAAAPLQVQRMALAAWPQRLLRFWNYVPRIKAHGSAAGELIA